LETFRGTQLERKKCVDSGDHSQNHEKLCGDDSEHPKPSGIINQLTYCLGAPSFRLDPLHHQKPQTTQWRVFFFGTILTGKPHDLKMGTSIPDATMVLEYLPTKLFFF